ncbi:LPS-assembly protein LptD [candidate division KSB1 bacterium]|nr:LPS-assembly protein LptD [candidate division KSB1 bacterium]
MLISSLAGQETKTNPDSLQQRLELKQPASSLLSDSLQAAEDSLSLGQIKTGDSGFDTTLFYEARIIDSDIDSNRFYLIGDAVVKYRNMTLKAAKITVDQDQEVLIAEGVPDTSYIFNEDSTAKEMQVFQKGTPEFKEGGEMLNGFKMIYNYRTRKGRVIRGRTDYESGKYFGEHIKKVGDKILYVTNGRFTTCDLEEEPHFYFRSRRMKIIPKDEIIAKPIVAYISGIPVAWFPLMFYPNKGGRHSGILIPRYGESASEGRYLQGLGYYWAPSDYFDATLKGNYYDRSGWMADGRLRYSKKYELDGNIAGSITKKEPVGGGKQNRWDLRIFHNQTINSTTRLMMNGNFVSDASFYRNYSSNIDQRLNRQLTSNATLSKSWPDSKNNLTVNLSHSKSLDDNSEMLLFPQISFTHSQRPLFRPPERTSRTIRRRDAVEESQERWYHSIYYSFSSRMINQTKKGQREPQARNISNSASLTMSGPQKLFGVLGWNHGVSYNDYMFDRSYRYYYDAERDSTDQDSIKRVVEKGFSSVRSFSYSASANTKLYGMFAPGIGNITAIRHVVTPSISYSYSPDFTTATWGYFQEVRDTSGKVIAEKFKFPGGFASTGQNSVGFSVQNLFQMKTATTVDGEEKENKYDLFYLNFSSHYNFKADSLRLSPLSSDLSANPAQNISVNMSARHDFYDYRIIKDRIFTVNKFLLFEKKWPRLSNFSFSISLRLQGKEKKKETPKSGEKAASENDQLSPLGASAVPGVFGDEFYEETDRFEAQSDFNELNIPWSASLFLDYSLDRYNPMKPTERFYIKLSNMQVKLTKNWSFRYQAHYDLQKKQLVNQSFNFARDLHCWEMNFYWVPSGPYREFYLKINVKASQLQDIKFERRGGRLSHRGYYY